jgi:hypothetical protein
MSTPARRPTVSNQMNTGGSSGRNMRFTTHRRLVSRPGMLEVNLHSPQVFIEECLTNEMPRVTLPEHNTETAPVMCLRTQQQLGTARGFSTAVFSDVTWIQSGRPCGQKVCYLGKLPSKGPMLFTPMRGLRASVSAPFSLYPSVSQSLFSTCSCVPKL